MNTYQYQIFGKNVDVFSDWVTESGKDLSVKMPHCREVSQERVCYGVLTYITSELKDPEKFYNFTIDLGTAVADEYFHRWETGICKNDEWKVYERRIARVTAKTMQEMVPGLIDDFVCDTERGSTLIENIIARYNTMKNR